MIRVSHVEEQALRDLHEKFSANKSRLMKEFLLKDPNKTGKSAYLFTIYRLTNCHLFHSSTKKLKVFHSNKSHKVTLILYSLNTFYSF